MSPRSLTLLFAALLAVPASLATLASPVAAEGQLVADVTITSFDGTALAATLFAPDGASESSPVPFVLMTHGWAGSRVAQPTGRVADLLDAGYGVLTWDSRGFGKSGGEVMLDHPEYEGRDVSVIIDWLVANAPVAMESADDPVIGMSGGSYAGGIQLLAAAHDARIDVIAPEITWNDLLQSLAPNGVPKTYWTSLLFGAGLATSCQHGHSASTSPSGCQTMDLARYYATVLATNGVTDEIRDALLVRSPATYIENISVPTLLVQGFPDTLFDVDQAIANYEGIKANGAPVKLWLYDGGHAGPNTQRGLISPLVVSWFDCYLSLAPDCTNVGPEVEYYAGGAWHAAASWPFAGDAGVRTVSGIPPLSVAPFPTGSSGSWVIDLETAAPGAETISVTGATLSFTGDATAPLGEARLFAALGVRDTAGRVARIDGQVQPLAIPGGQAPASYTLDLVDVAARLAPGESLVLMLATTDNAYANARSAGFVYLRDVSVTWSSFDTPAPAAAPRTVAGCGEGADLSAAPATGPGVLLAMESAEYDALEAATGGVRGTTIVTQDGEPVADATVSLVIQRGTWIGNLGREHVTSVKTNAFGAACFDVPVQFALPGAYVVHAEARVGGAFATARASYAVGA